jgi:probable phosphoglycerate mutase
MLAILIRHGTTDAVGQRLVGRLPGISLNDTGRAQARRLARRLAEQPLRAIYSSPLERAVETAREVALPHDLPLVLRPALTDFDFGEWSGKTLDELKLDRRFQLFNQHRAGTRAPGGEHIAEVQARMVAELDELGRTHSNDMIAVVSHADPLRSLIGFFLGTPVDLLRRIEISPGSMAALSLTEYDARLLFTNHTEVPSFE